MNFENGIIETGSNNLEQEEEINPVFSGLPQKEQSLFSRLTTGWVGALARSLLLATTLLVAEGKINEEVVQAKEPAKIEHIEKEKIPVEKFFKIRYQENKKNNPEVLEKVSEISLYIIYNKEIIQLSLLPDELKNNPVFFINGYLAEIEITGENGISFKFNDEKIKRITDEGATIISIEKNGMPISVTENNNITFNSNAGEYTIIVKQKSPQEVKIMDSLSFRYIGNQIDGLSSIDKIEEKIEAIASGINNVKFISDDNLIENINFIDNNASSIDAYADAENRSINFSTKFLKEFSSKRFKSTAEHETLHNYINNRRYSKDPKIRILFADLKGYIGEKKEEIIEYGSVFFDQLNKNYKNKVFFNFINESNFFKSGSVDGHSQDNVDEFLASFIHSLLYLDKLEKNLNLSTPLEAETRISPKSEKIILSNKEKIIILDNYIVTLEVLIKNIETISVNDGISDNNGLRFFREKLAIVKQIKERILNSQK